MYKIINGDSAERLKDYDDNYFDSVVCDPPYGIEFLAKEWDKNTGAIEVWQECYRVLKPGGHLLAFSAARTYHKLATNIESVGFEIRDQIMWLYATGFPKAQDVGKHIDKMNGKLVLKETGETYISGGPKETPNGPLPRSKKMKHIPSKDNVWVGWKTALKPAHEPIVMARKPMIGSTAKNVLKHGTGALNIDGSRIPFEDEADAEPQKPKKKDMPSGGKGHANTFHNGNAETYHSTDKKENTNTECYTPNDAGRYPSNVIGEVEGHQKFFYCPKVSSRNERNVGMEESPKPFAGVKHGHEIAMPTNGQDNQVTKLDAEKVNNKGNNHPTVKPVALMSYLVKLVTPPGGIVLDPFCGSGSTGMACVQHEFEFVGIELNERYCEIATKRIDAWKKEKVTTFNQIFKETT